MLGRARELGLPEVSCWVKLHNDPRSRRGVPGARRRARRDARRARPRPGARAARPRPGRRVRAALGDRPADDARQPPDRRRRLRRLDAARATRSPREVERADSATSSTGSGSVVAYLDGAPVGCGGISLVDGVPGCGAAPSARRRAAAALTGLSSTRGCAAASSAARPWRWSRAGCRPPARSCVAPGSSGTARSGPTASRWADLLDHVRAVSVPPFARETVPGSPLARADFGTSSRCRRRARRSSTHGPVVGVTHQMPSPAGSGASRPYLPNQFVDDPSAQVRVRGHVGRDAFEDDDLLPALEVHCHGRVAR